MYHRHTQRYALAASLALGIVYSLKTAFLVFARDLALKLCAHVKHMDSLDPAITANIKVTAANFLSGLAQVMLWTYVVIMLFGCIACWLKPHFGDEGCCPPGQGGGNTYR